jgi:hypothetical protein
MIFGLLTPVMFSAVSFAQTFEESVALLPAVDVINAKKETAQAIALKSFTTYKLLPRYVFNSVDFTDDGKFNDAKAGDGIYTSMYSTTKPEHSFPNNAVIDEKFTKTEQLNSWIETNRLGIGVGISCKFRWVYSGSSWFGNSCASGCLELYDCKFEVIIGDKKK